MAGLLPNLGEDNATIEALLLLGPPPLGLPGRTELARGIALLPEDKPPPRPAAAIGKDGTAGILLPAASGPVDLPGLAVPLGLLTDLLPAELGGLLIIT